MPLEYQAILKSFNAAAPHYDENAILQKEVLTRLLERLEDEKKINPNFNTTQVLDLGCGTGLAIPKILKLFPLAKILALDFSKAMLQRAPKTKAVQTFLSDVHDLPFAEASVDVVFSNMLLHWSNEKDVFKESLRVLKPGGMLLMSALGETSLFELKQAWLAVDGKDHVHSFPALHNMGDDLLRIGFEQVVVNAEVITLTYKDVIALMKDIKASGGHNSDEARKKGLLPRCHLIKLQQAYEAFRQEGRLPASYEIVYLRAIKSHTD